MILREKLLNKVTALSKGRGGKCEYHYTVYDWCRFHCSYIYVPDINTPCVCLVVPCFYSIMGSIAY